jgi:hypothetical protein
MRFSFSRLGRVYYGLPKPRNFGELADNIERIADELQNIGVGASFESSMRAPNLSITHKCRWQVLCQGRYR